MKNLFEVPRNMKNALAAGWTVEGLSGTASRDENVERGTMFLTNQALPGIILEIDYTAVKSFGSPRMTGEFLTLENYQAHMDRLRRAAHRQFVS